MVDRALVHGLVGDQLVLLVEEQHPELFARLVRQGDADIGEQGGPRRNHRALGHRLAADAQGGLVHQLQIERDGLADAADRAQFRNRGGEHRRKTPKTRQKRLGQRLDVAHRDRAEEVEFEKFIVRQGVEPTLQRPGTETFAVSAVRRRRTRPLRPEVRRQPNVCSENVAHGDNVH